MKNRIAELGIKQWWLAEQVGVDRKTVIRWIHGQVRSIQVENAGKLAQILECHVSELKVDSAADQLATPEDQKAAAAVLATSSLIEKLGPIGEWNVIESLLKAVLVPNLPLSVLGELYDQLTIASWRQSKIDQASLYNAKTEELALRANDKCLLASALLSKANLLSWKGHVQKAIQTYQECLRFEKYIEAKTRAAVHSNLGGLLYESGDLQAGQAEIRTALEIFKEDGRPIHFCIAHTHLAIIHLQKGEVEKAEQEVQVLLNYGKMDDFRRGLYFGKLLLGEVRARQGKREEAISNIEHGLDQFSKMNFIEGLNYEIAGRSYRLLGELDQAQVHLQTGISVASEFPLYLAALYGEHAAVLFEKKNPQWKVSALEAINLYQKCECPLRVDLLKKRFGIKLPS